MSLPDRSESESRPPPGVPASSLVGAIPPRPPNHEPVSLTLAALARSLADHSASIFDDLARAVQTLCRAGSAAISVEHPAARNDDPLWCSVAGPFTPAPATRLSRDDVTSEVEGYTVTLMRDQPFLASIQGSGPSPSEALIARWSGDDGAIVTIWAFAHVSSQHFDGEDARVLGILLPFAAAAWQAGSPPVQDDVAREVAIKTQALREKGERFWANEIVSAIRDGDGQLLGFSRASRDLTERGRAEEALRLRDDRYRALFDAMDQAFCVIEVIVDDRDVPVDYRYVETNPVFEHQTGLHDPVGKTIREMVPDIETSWIEMFGKVARTGDPVRAVDHAVSMGRWFDVNGFRIGEPHERTVAVFFYDITEPKRHEVNLAFLAEVGELFSRLTSTEEIMHAVGERTALFFDATSSFLVDVDVQNDRGTLQFLWTASGSPSLPNEVFLSDFLSGDFYRAAQAGEAIVVSDTQSDPRANAAQYAALDIGSYLTIPVLRDGVWSYLLAVCDSRPRQWREDEVAILRELSYRIFPRLERARIETRLRASEERFRTLIQNSNDAIQLIAPDGTIVYSSASVETVLGYTPDELHGKSIAPFIHPEDLTGVRNWLARVAEQPEAVGTREYRIRHRNGLWLWLEATIANHLDTPHLNALVGNFRNISSRRAVEEALRESEERFRTIVEQASDFAIFALDTEQRIVTWPAGAQAVLGWHEHDVIGHHFDVTFTPEDRLAGVPEQEIATARERGVAPDVRWHLREDGSRVFIEGSTHALRRPDGTLRGYFKIGRDVTERRQAEATRRIEDERLRQELETRVFAATAELRSLSRRLLEVQEEERRHLARELHDEIGQVLTGLGLRLGDGGSLAPADLADARRIVQQLTQQVRQLSMDLRPAVLDTYGILPALVWHIERYQSQTGIKVDLRHEGIDRRFAAPVEITAYRIVQEALTNVARHSSARLAVVQLLAEGDVLNVSIRDDGHGFDYQTVPGSSGLGGMRERVELLGGVVAIDTSPGAGVLVTAELPTTVPGQEMTQ